MCAAVAGGAELRKEERVESEREKREREKKLFSFSKTVSFNPRHCLFFFCSDVFSFFFVLFNGCNFKKPKKVGV